jgi:hypothetical protein
VTQFIRPATAADVPQIADLLMQDARRRHAADPILWAMADDASARIADAVTLALTSVKQPFRQSWLVAEGGGALVGVMHSMLLPVPPIYAGPFGMPGLLLPDSFLAEDAPEGMIDALVEAAEADLRDAGARITISTLVTGEEWRSVFARRGYEPLTFYLSRTDLGVAAMPVEIRAATENDVPDIVRRSAENRAVLFEIDPFWEVHPEADVRFGAWMRRSLALEDRDMRVLGPTGALEGYVIAQPASRLHFPAAHDIGRTGLIDDYYHPDFADPLSLSNGGTGATALLRAAESALADRGASAALVVCPAGWRSKLDVLEAAGYETAMVWSIKR